MLETLVIGNLGKDCEIKEWKDQKLIAFNVGVNESYIDKDGVKHEKTTWISCLKPVFKDNTKIAQYLKKGTQVYLRGKISARTFQKTDGTVEAGLNLRVDDIQLLGGQKETETRQTVQSPSSAPAAQPAKATTPLPTETPTTQMPSDDDLPF